MWKRNTCIFVNGKGYSLMSVEQRTAITKRTWTHICITRGILKRLQSALLYIQQKQPENFSQYWLLDSHKRFQNSTSGMNCRNELSLGIDQWFKYINHLRIHSRWSFVSKHSKTREQVQDNPSNHTYTHTLVSSGHQNGSPTRPLQIAWEIQMKKIEKHSKGYPGSITLDWKQAFATSAAVSLFSVFYWAELVTAFILRRYGSLCVNLFLSGFSG